MATTAAPQPTAPHNGTMQEWGAYRAACLALEVATAAPCALHQADMIAHDGEVACPVCLAERAADRY